MKMTNEEAINELKGRYLSISAFADKEQCNKANEALDIAIQAIERLIPKKPKHTHIKHGKHTWKKTEDGEIDDSAWDNDRHCGVICEICGETVCVYCNPNYDELTDCEEEYWNCPSCGKKIHSKVKYCDCGQKLDWSDTDEN